MERTLDIKDWYKNCKTYNHRGHNIPYRIGGNGTPLLLLHGFPTASADWQPIWDELVKKYRVIAPDLMGFGLSDKPTDYDYNLIDQSNMVQNLVVSLGYQQCHILCHDYSVSIAQELLAREQDGSAKLKIASVCFLNGGLFPEMHKALTVQKLMCSPIGKYLAKTLTEKNIAASLASVFGPNTQPSENEQQAFFQLMDANNGRAIFHKLIRYMHDRRKHRDRWVNALKESSVRKRLINGYLDPVSGKHLADYYRQQIPDADVVGLVDIGHYPQVEAPEIVLKHYLSFRAATYNA